MLDSNIVIYLDIAGLLPACGRLAERGLARVVIPGEVKKELGVKGIPKDLIKLEADGLVHVVQEPALDSDDHRGRGEDHAIAIAQAMAAKGQDAIVVTSDIKALRKADLQALASLDIAGFVLGLYEKQAITGDEKEQALQRLVDSGIISPRYGPSP